MQLFGDPFSGAERCSTCADQRHVSPAPAGYQTVCDDLPNYSNATSLKPAPEFVADTNGDGLDTLEFRGDTTARILGIGDFLGNGRQLPLFTPSDSVKKGVPSRP